ncbi:MAG: aldo/keto reductase [bacterium]|nr:aldo/keto reductase [bacterium]
MSELNRRQFIERSVASAAVLSSATGLVSHAAESQTAEKRSAFDRVELGHTGIKVSRLAQGTGMHGGNQESDHTRLGQEKFTELIRHGFDKGLNFFDMADLYGSHPFVRRAISDLPRKDYALLSKIWFRKASWIEPSGGAKEEVHRFLKELNTDYIDVCLIHCVTDANWVDDLEHVRKDMSELKEEGKLRSVGVSCHDFGALKVAAEHPWTDVILARINYMGGKQYKMDASVEEVTEVLKTARKNGKAIIGMKIFGEGTLTKPEQKDASMKYVAGGGLVDAMTIGMLSTEQVDDASNRLTNALNA